MMEFSLFSALECPDGRRPEDVYRETLALFAYSEELGFRGAWVGEHHFSDYGALGNAAVFLAALAARTTHYRLGASFSILPFHDPIRLAEDYAVVDVISGGRLDFGSGRGYRPIAFRSLGVDLAEARARLLETLEIVDMAWREGCVDFQGEYYRYAGNVVRPEPIQAPVPLYLATVWPEAERVAHRRGYNVLSSLLSTGRGSLVERLSAHRRALAPADRGRVRLSLLTPVFVADTNDAAFRDALPEFAWYWDAVGCNLPAVEDDPDDSHAYFRKLAERHGDGRRGVARSMARWPIGDVDRVSRFLIDLARDTTCDEIVCFASIGAMEFRKVARNIELIAGEVMPRVRAALAEFDRAGAAKAAAG